jgi:hypothetical protein
MENNLRKITKEVGDLVNIRDPVKSLLWTNNHLKKVTVQSDVAHFYADAALWTERSLYYYYIILI